MFRRKGISYIEVIVSITILSISIIPILNLIYSSMENTKRYIENYTGILYSKNLVLEVENELKKNDEMLKTIQIEKILLNVLNTYKRNNPEYEYFIEVAMAQGKFSLGTKKTDKSINTQINYLANYHKEDVYDEIVQCDENKTYVINAKKNNLRIKVISNGYDVKIIINNSNNNTIVSSDEIIEIENKKGTTVLINDYLKNNIEYITSMVFGEKGNLIGTTTK